MTSPLTAVMLKPRRASSERAREVVDQRAAGQARDAVRAGALEQAHRQAVADAAALPGVGDDQRHRGLDAAAACGGVAPDAHDLPGRLVDGHERLVAHVIDVGQGVELARAEPRLGAEEALAPGAIAEAREGVRKGLAVGGDDRTDAQQRAVGKRHLARHGLTLRRRGRPASPRCSRLCSVPSAMPSSRAASPAR